MTRVVLDVADVADLELLAEAAEAVASQRRVAAELFAAELSRAKAAGEDVRTRSVHTIEILGEAGRLVAAAAALRSTSPAPPPPVTRAGADPAEPGTAAATSAASASAAPPAGDGPARRSRARKTAHSAASTPGPSFGGEPEPTDPHAAETLANLRAAGEAALGPDAGHAPAAAESSEVPEPTAEQVEQEVPA